MHFQTTRLIARYAHYLIAAYQVAYIYGPLHRWSYGLAMEQWLIFPLLLISGIWLRKGHVIWHSFAARNAIPSL